MAGDRMRLNLEYLPERRFIEYPWVLMNLELEKGGTILDVGCCETLFPIMLACQGYKVTGIDVKPYNCVHENFTFLQRDILDHHGIYDRIVCISTIEHIGLMIGEKEDLNADRKALLKMRELLEEDGKILLTTQYSSEFWIARSPYKDFAGRYYDRSSLEKLIRGFHILKEDFFLGESRRFVPVTQETLDKKAGKPRPFGVVCLCLR